MSDDELEDIAAQLEKSANLDKAESHLTTGQPFLWLTGTRDALIYLAAACLRAAASSIPDEDTRSKPTSLQHRQIDETKKDYVLGAVQRIDEFPENPEVIAERKKKAWRTDQACLLGCAIIVLICFFTVASAVMLWWEIWTGQR